MPVGCQPRAAGRNLATTAVRLPNGGDVLVPPVLRILCGANEARGGCSEGAGRRPRPHLPGQVGFPGSALPRAAGAGGPAGSPRTRTGLFISPLSCDLVFGLDTKAIWEPDRCQEKGPLSYPSRPRGSGSSRLLPFPASVDVSYGQHT